MSMLEETKNLKSLLEAVEKVLKPEVEQIDEISKKKAQDYINKADGDSFDLHYKAEALPGGIHHSTGDYSKKEMADARARAHGKKKPSESSYDYLRRKSDKRFTGVDLAMAKIDGKGSTYHDHEKYKDKTVRVGATGKLKEQSEPRKLSDILEDMKRGRGRPKKKRNLAGEIVESSLDEELKRERGRPKKRRNEAGEIVDDDPGVQK